MAAQSHSHAKSLLRSTSISPLVDNSRLAFTANWPLATTLPHPFGTANRCSLSPLHTTQPWPTSTHLQSTSTTGAFIACSTTLVKGQSSLFGSRSKIRGGRDEWTESQCLRALSSGTESDAWNAWESFPLREGAINALESSRLRDDARSATRKKERIGEMKDQAIEAQKDARPSAQRRSRASSNSPTARKQISHPWVADARVKGRRGNQLAAASSGSVGSDLEDLASFLGKGWMSKIVSPLSSMSTFNRPPSIKRPNKSSSAKAFRMVS